MIRLHAGTPGSHPLSVFTQTAVRLSGATHENVELTYNNVTIIVTHGMTTSEAYEHWHATANEARRDQSGERPNYAHGTARLNKCIQLADDEFFWASISNLAGPGTAAHVKSDFRWLVAELGRTIQP